MSSAQESLRSGKEQDIQDALKATPEPEHHDELPDLEAQKDKKKFTEADAGDGTMIFDQYMTGMPLVLCFLACFVSLFLIGLDQTIVATILDTVGTEFNDYQNIGWVTSGYMLSLAVFAQTWGRISIIFGRKYALLIGIVLFEAGSLMSALAPTMNVLIGGRVLSGIGGAGIQTLVFVIVSEVVPINRRPLVFAALIGMMSLSTVTGPLIGGAFTENVSWRWCFYINLPVGGLAMTALTFFYHPPMPKFTWREKLKMVDYLGAALLACGFVLFLLALSFGGNRFPWRSGAVISMFILGPLVLVAFGIWTFKYSSNPIIPYSIISTPRVMFPSMTIFFAFFYFFGLVLYLSTYFQIIHNSSPIQTGLHLLPFIIAMVIFAFSSGILMRRTRYIKPFSVAGGIIAPISAGLCTLLSVDSSSSANIGYLILPGVSMGLILQSSTISAQMHAPKDPGAMILVTAMTNFTRAVGGAIGGELSQTIYNSSVKSKGEALFNAHPELFEGMTKSEVTDLLASPSSISTLPEATKKALLECIMGGIRNVFYMCIGITFLILFCTIMNSNKRIPKAEDIQTKEEHENEKHLKEASDSKEEADEQDVSINNSNDVAEN